MSIAERVHEEGIDYYQPVARNVAYLVCGCPIGGNSSQNTSNSRQCDDCRHCKVFEWTWDKNSGTDTAIFRNDDREVFFNPGFSVGTAAFRGTKPLEKNRHHYWEILMATEAYGTDMMIGVCTEAADLRKYSHSFVSLVGLDEHSFGLSYNGDIQHKGQVKGYTGCFGQNAIVGVHLDTWRGTLEYFIDRKPLGVAFNGLKEKILYPIVSSTAARSGMNLIFCRSYPESLQLRAMLQLGRQLAMPDNIAMFKVLALPPGLKLWMKNNYWWIVSARGRKQETTESENISDTNNRVVKTTSTSEKSSSSSKSEEKEKDSNSSMVPEGRITRSRARAASGRNEPVAGPSTSSTGTSNNSAKTKSSSAPSTPTRSRKAAKKDSDLSPEPKKRMCLRSQAKK